MVTYNHVTEVVRNKCVNHQARRVDSRAGGEEGQEQEGPGEGQGGGQEAEGQGGQGQQGEAGAQTQEKLDQIVKLDQWTGYSRRFYQ